jgi:hypothetical protein
VPRPRRQPQTLANTWMRRLWAQSRSQLARSIPALVGSCFGEPTQAFHLLRATLSNSTFPRDASQAYGASSLNIINRFVWLIFNAANGRYDQQIKNIIANGCAPGGGGCAQTYTVVSGDTCAAIESKTGVSDAQLHALNPAINSGCTSMFSFHLFISICAKCFC